LKGKILWLREKSFQYHVMTKFSYFRCVSQGNTLLIENLDEDIEPVLDPLLGRVLIKKGKAIRLGDKVSINLLIIFKTTMGRNRVQLVKGT